MSSKYLVMMARRARTEIRGEEIQQPKIFLCPVPQEPGKINSGFLLDPNITVPSPATLIFRSPEIELDDFFTQNFQLIPVEQIPNISKIITDPQAHINGHPKK